MKYVRTKDVIYEITEQDIENHCLVIKVNENRHDLIHESLGIKQAGTIEELCDEFVWVSIDDEYCNRKANLYGLKTSKMQVNCPQIKCIYGAIWTDKGLIYVAKMNDKGELELL